MNMSTSTVKMAGHSPAALARRDLSARQAITAAGTVMAAVTLLDVIIDGKIGLLFSIGFVLISVTTPLSVDARSLFGPGILPPLLMIASILILSIAVPAAIPADGISATAGTLQRLIAGVIDQATALIIGHLLALGTIGLRILTSPDN